MSKQRNPDHVRRRNVPGPSNEVVEERLMELVKPEVDKQSEYYKSLGLRERLLGLPMMVALVLTTLWRQVPSRRELTRMVRREKLLWCDPVKVSQVALNNRFLTFPASIFERILKGLLPRIKVRWEARTNRPLPPSIAIANQYFENIWAADGSTLEALFRKLDSLKDVKPGTLAGKMFTVFDMISYLPVDIWYDENPFRHDTNFFDQLLALLPDKKPTLLIFDRGLYCFTFFADIIAKKHHFITRPKSNLVYTSFKILSWTDQVRDQIIIVGDLELRLIQVKFCDGWYSYLTSVLDPNILPPVVVADLYQRRWSIETVFEIVKHTLHLAYLWTGSINGVLLQIWGTWLFYTILVDLGDMIADAIELPFERISIEMTFRGLYHFNNAFKNGLADDLIDFFTHPDNKDLGIVKPLRKPKLILDFAPFHT